MPYRIVVESEFAESPREVMERYLPGTYRVARSNEQPDLWLDIKTFDSGLFVRPIVATDGFVKRLAEQLAQDFSSVTAFHFELVGTKSPEVMASETKWTNGEARHTDISRDCADMVDEIMDGETEINEVDRDFVSNHVLEVLPDAFIPDQEFSLRFVATVSKRLLTLMNLLEDGATWEWVELYGQKAVKVTGDGESQISVLNADEVAEFERQMSPDD